MKRHLFTLAALLLVAPQSLAAQPSQSRADRFMRDCEDRGGRREVFCEVRDATMRPPSGRLSIDGGNNGGISVYSWDRNEVQVRALVQTYADTREEAAALARDIRVITEGDRIRADGPASRRYSHWGVSFEVWVPRRTNLDADAQNGGIRVEAVDGEMTLRTVNGGISLREVSGDVRAETTNGGVSAELTGNTWNGRGLDLTTTNGGVNLEIPRAYNAVLETGTVNGGMNIDFPITVQGFIGRRITTTLGSGGPRVRAMTTNGGVRIRER